LQESPYEENYRNYKFLILVYQVISTVMERHNERAMSQPRRLFWAADDQ
jgi:hypothetical protein